VSYSVRGFHMLVFSRGVVALFLGTGCVSTPQYEQVSSAAEVEREAHRRTHLELEAAERRLAELDGKLDQSQGSLSAHENEQAELALKQTTTERELSAARELAADLREEVVRLQKALDALDRSRQGLEAENKKLTLALERAEERASEATPPSEPQDDSDESVEPREPKKHARSTPAESDDEPPDALVDGG
jgi:chromosome segregation ATPase